MSKSDLIPDDDYRELLENLKGRIRSSQIEAAIAVNNEMIRLYWQIGREYPVPPSSSGLGRDSRLET